MGRHQVAETDKKKIVRLFLPQAEIDILTIPLIRSISYAAVAEALKAHKVYPVSPANVPFVSDAKLLFHKRSVKQSAKNKRSIPVKKAG